MKLQSSLLLCFLLSYTLAWEWPTDSPSNDYCYPDQVHISLGDAYYNSWNKFASVKSEASNSSVIIVWQSQSRCDNFYVTVQDESETMKLNITTENIWTELQNATIDHRRNHLYPSQDGRYISYSHTAMIPNLKPGVHYTYQISQTNSSNTAGPFTFMLPEMSPKDTDQPIKFAVYSNLDTLQTNSTLHAFKRLKKEKPDDISFHLFLGNLGFDLYSENGKKGEYFYNSWQNTLATTPFMVTPGNREIYGNYSFLNMRTRMPLYNQTQNHYYSFNIGKMHILAINYYFYRDTTPENQKRMFEWIEADLKAANASRSERPWVVIATHQPIYCSFNSMSDQPSKRCYNFYERWVNFEELYFKYRADMVLQGHIAYWERTGPTYKNASLNYSSWSESRRKSHMINPEGPIYTIEGAPGNGYYMAGWGGWDVERPSGSPTPLVNYSINVDSNYGFSTLTIVNGSALKYEHIDSQSGELIDYFYVLKGDEYRAVGFLERKSALLVLVAALCGLGMMVGVYLSRKEKMRKIGLLSQEEGMSLELF